MLLSDCGGGGAFVACSTKSEGTLSKRGPHFRWSGYSLASQARHYFQFGGGGGGGGGGGSGVSGPYTVASTGM